MLLWLTNSNVIFALVKEEAIPRYGAIIYYALIIIGWLNGGKCQFRLFFVLYPRPCIDHCLNRRCFPLHIVFNCWHVISPWAVYTSRAYLAMILETRNIWSYNPTMLVRTIDLKKKPCSPTICAKTISIQLCLSTVNAPFPIFQDYHRRIRLSQARWPAWRFLGTHWYAWGWRERDLCYTVVEVAFQKENIMVVNG